jgi:DNA-binding response OmpR family regulator/anti-anti-sigma regulatory factor
MYRPPSSTLVLIADDDPLHLEVLCNTIAAEEIDVAAARDGEAALKIAGREMPDLILLDAFMPGLDGFETCRLLKANPKTVDIPVIFMTSLTETRYRLQGFSVGAVDYVTKPIEPAEMLARVRTHLSLRRATWTLAEKNAQLSQEIRERAAAEQKLERTMEELREANERLSHELAQRECAEAARMALQEQIIAVQRGRLQELSAPLIPITDEILVMPLIGTIDVERAGQAVEMALRGASERNATYLIVDLTGVKVVDTIVATMLIQTARGLDLLGTRAIITGIRPEVAQMLVRLDLLLDALVTKATLQAGVEYALKAHAIRTRR